MTTTAKPAPVPVAPTFFKTERQLQIETLIGELCVSIRAVEQPGKEPEEALRRYQAMRAARQAVIDAYMELAE